jgi:hypothetical protein
MTVFQKICEYHFKLSQTDLVWFPFLFLRPKSDQEISHQRVLLMSLCFAVFAYALYILRRVFSPEGFIVSAQELFYFFVGFFFWFELVTRPLWNYWVRKFIRK